MDWFVVTSHWAQSGQTTVAVQLATELANRGLRAAFVDLTSDRRAQNILDPERVAYHSLTHDDLATWAESADADIAVVDADTLERVTHQPVFDAAHFLWLVPDDPKAVTGLVAASEIVTEARAAGRSLTVLGFVLTQAKASASLAEPFMAIAKDHSVCPPIPQEDDLAQAYAPLCRTIIGKMAWGDPPEPEAEPAAPPKAVEEEAPQKTEPSIIEPAEFEAMSVDLGSIDVPSASPSIESSSQDILPFPAPADADVSLLLTAPPPAIAALMASEPPAAKPKPPAPEPEPEAALPVEVEAPPETPSPEIEPEEEAPAEPEPEEDEPSPAAISKPPGYAYVFDASELEDKTEARTGVPFRPNSQAPTPAENAPASTTVRLVLDDTEPVGPSRKTLAWGLIAFGVVLFVVAAAFLSG